MPFELSVETVGACTRVCPTCERNSAPFPMPGRFGKLQKLPDELFTKILADAKAMDFSWINLQHYDEPLLDNRIDRLAAQAKATGLFSKVYMHSNGDRMSKSWANRLDGVLDEIVIALYDSTGGRPMDESLAAPRRAQIESWFGKTKVRWTGGTHLITHWSPFTNLQEEVAAARPMPCTREAQLRMIIDYRGQMLMCCDDIMGVWNLGNVADHTLEELWNSPLHKAGVRHTRSARSVPVSTDGVPHEG
jgi:hypothetical protein